MNIPQGDFDRWATQEETRGDDVGMWKGGRTEGRRTALLKCPGCGQVASLSDHEIADDGTVTPSGVCPYECGFHEHIVLEGWTP